LNCCFAKEIPLLTCDIAPSLRLLVPSSLQVRRPLADANRYRLRSKMPLGPVGMNRRFWRAFTWSPANCSLLRAARSRLSGEVAATARRQVTRHWPPAFRSSAASSYAVGVLSPFISPSKSLSSEIPVPPHFQHTCRLFLWLSVGLDRVSIDAVGASLTGTSS
jgi:hypothetical protein